MSLAPGAELGAYRIIAILGSGGMGEVYRAHDTRLGRDVALKILPDAMAQDPDGLARFEREARSVAALNHPHIVTIYTNEEAAGVRFLTMELIEGRTLDQLIPAGGLSLTQFFEIAAALADALHAAHQKHITHRDLKPSNIMVTDDGRVKVLDFGLASANKAPGADLTVAVTRPALTKVGTILGTMPYMSPEQIEAKPIDHRSDLFSLGVVLYEMATGQRPFSGDSSPALMSSILRDHPEGMNERRPGIPEGAGRLIARCLEKSPRDRVQSAHDVLEEIRAVRRAWESGVSTPPPKIGASARRSPSIAVLPFRDMSAAKDQDWFCDGIAEEILNALAQLSGLKVAARASAFSFRDSKEDLAAIGKKLHVTTVLDGSVRRAGDRVRITARLSNVQDGYQLWSERYDREMKDIFDVQDEIARAIAERLRITLAGEADARLVPQATTNVEAYQVYLQGRALLYKRGPSVPLALELFQKAVELDPDYGLAWTGIADVFTVFGYYGAGRPGNIRPLAIEAANRAIDLDPKSAESRTAMAAVMLFYQNDLAGAEREFLRAIELNPNYIQCRTWYAVFYLAWTRGRFDEALAQARHGLALDPFSSYTLTVLTLVLGTMRHDEEAIASGRRATAADPESMIAHFALGEVLLWAGRGDEAIASHREACRVSAQSTFATMSLANALGAAGRSHDARDLLSQLVTRAGSQYVSPAQLAIVARAAGDREAALRLVRESWEIRDPFLIALCRYNPNYQWFREQPEFQAILREMDA